MDRLGKYDIRSILGRGAMGTVYEGWDPRIARRVAIKTVKLPDSDDAEEKETIDRFQREAQAAGQMHHPNIVGVFDFGETDELAYIVMEFVAGRTLKQVMDEDGRPSMAEVGRMMSGLLAGLSYSHAHNVIHRDIKPANVIVTASGDVKIADFGIARIESSTMTQAGTMMGTPAYMSPEQFQGIGVDSRTDIYSAGVVLFQLLTGKRPFEGSMATIMNAVLNGVPKRPSELESDIPPALDAVVARAMARSVDDRYPTAAAFDAALKAALSGQPVAPAPGASMLGGSLDELLEGGDATVVRPTRPAAEAPARPGPAAAAPKPAARPPAQTGPASKLPLVLAGVGALAVLGGGGAFFALRGSEPAEAPVRTAAVTAAPSTPAPSTPLVAAPATAVAQSQAASPAPAAPTPPAPTAAARPVTPPTPVVPEPGPATPSIAVAPAIAAPPTVMAPPPIPKTVLTPPPASPAAAPEPAVAIVPPAPPAPAPAATVSVPAPQPVTPPPAPAPLVPVPAAAPEPPPVTTAFNQPSVESIRRALATALRAAPCTAVTGDDRLPAGLAVRGVVGRGAGEEALRAALQDAAPGVPVDWQVGVAEGPYCPLLDVLRPFVRPLNAPGRATSVAMKDGKATLVTEDRIMPRVTMPDFAGHLQLDYVQSDGGLTHMATALPTPTYPASATPTFGEPGPRSTAYAVDKPYGTDLVVAIVSSQPLFRAPRRDDDTLEVYLRDLRTALEQAARAGRVSASVAMVRTEPK